MHRRKAIRRFCLIVGGLGASYSGFKLYQLQKRPDLRNLAAHRELIDALADAIIPATDSPGAAAAGTGAFIIKMIEDCTDRSSQNKFIDGLSAVEDYSKDHFDKSFIQCSSPEKDQVLAHFEKAGHPYNGIAGKAEHKLFGDSFFVTLKKYTVLGYCSSKIGATQALAYDYIPGKYIGTIPLAPGQKAWATR